MGVRRRDELLEGAERYEQGGAEDEGEEQGVGRGRADAEPGSAIVEAGRDSAELSCCGLHFGRLLVAS